MIRWITFLLIVLITEFYSYQAVRTAIDNTRIQRIYLLVSLAVLLYIIYSITQFDRTQSITHKTMWTMAIFLLMYVPKILITLIMFTGDVFRLLFGSVRYFADSGASEFLPGRRKFVAQTALALAAVPFFSLIHGIFKGRYNYRVLKETLHFDDLPDEFDGFQILQLSDIHCGSFDNHEKIKYGIDLINEQSYDVLVFTGDLVNSKASEMDDWEGLLSEIRTPEFGKFSVLGNHDYGEYIQWPDEKSKLENLEAVKALHPKLDFKLLLNENVKINKGNSSLSVVGVENWGKNFQQYGDLEKASTGLIKEDFKILLTHDPTHWDIQVKDNPMNYHLTLCGHTHGMQFGIEIPGWIRWSPSKYIYKHWAGLYSNAKKYLYVNRGFGYLAYPGRVGIWPEITLLELKKKENS